MRPLHKAAALAFAACFATAAYAKTDYDSNTRVTSTGDNAFGAPAFAKPPQSAFATDSRPIAKPLRPGGVQVTPVPEPGEWALMAAGLALVGFIARRNRKK